MKIILNGEPLTLKKQSSINSLLEQHGYNGKLIAVAINNEFLPKSAYATTIIQDNDKIEIVAPMQGG